MDAPEISPEWDFAGGCKAAEGVLHVTWELGVPQVAPLYLLVEKLTGAAGRPLIAQWRHRGALTFSGVDAFAGKIVSGL